MANLIEYIQSQVYENSTEDISGSIMQQVLTRMASDEGVVNVHTISGQTPFADYNNAQAARDAVPAGFKKLGLIITYKLSSGWYIDEFIGSATSGWSTASNWKCLGPISISQNASTGKTTITIGSESFDVATQPVSVSQNTRTERTEWQAEHPYAVGDKVSYDNSNLECITAHTSASLFTLYESTFWKYVENSGNDVLTVGNDSAEFADADKLIEIFAFKTSSDSWDDVPVGGVCYDTTRKKLIKKESSGQALVPFYKGGLYVYNNHVYLWNGNDFNPTSYALSDNLIDSSLYISGGIAEDGSITDSATAKVTPYIDIHKYNLLRLLGGENRNVGIQFYSYYKQYIGTLSWDSNKTIEIPINAYYFRKIVKSSGYAEETSLNIIGIVTMPSEKDVNLSKYRTSDNLINTSDYLTGCGLDDDGYFDPTRTAQSVTPFIRVQGYKYITIENVNRKLGIYWYDRELKVIGVSAYPNDLGLAVPSNAYYFRRTVQSQGYNIENNLIIKGLYDDESAFVSNLYNKDLDIDTDAYEDGGLYSIGFNEYSTTQRRTDFIDCKDVRVIYLKNVNRELGVCFYNQNRYPISAVAYAKEIRVPENAFYLRKVVKSYGYEEETDLEIKAICDNGYSVESVYNDEPALMEKVVAIVKPEDFEGNTLAEKVIAANNYILNTKGGFIFRFEDSDEYVITQAIEIPSNTTIEIVGCTIRMADNTIDNIFRSANCKPNPNNYYGFSISDPLEVIKNVRIIGTGDAKIIHCTNSDTSGALNTAWRGVTTYLYNVNGFELAGLTIEKNLCWSQVFDACRYGTIHDLVFKTERENGDGLDITNGSHDIQVYNISGYTEDDTIAIGNSDEMRYGVRTAEQTMPMTPHYLGIYINQITKYQIFNIWINNVKVYLVDAAGTLDFLSNAKDGQLHDIHISDVSDVETTNANKTAYMITNWTNEYGMHYEDGDFSNIFINNVVQKGPNVRAIVLLRGMYHDSHFNNIEKTGSTPYLTNDSGIDPTDANFVITNEH